MGHAPFSEIMLFVENVLVYTAQTVNIITELIHWEIFKYLHLLFPATPHNRLHHCAS